MALTSTWRQKRSIARGTEVTANVVEVSLSAKGKTGRGESHGTLRYHETSDSIVQDVNKARSLPELSRMADVLKMVPEEPHRL